MQCRVTLLSFLQGLNAADRAGLYNDVFALANAGLLSYTIALNFSCNLANESDYVPWNTMSTTFINILRLLASTDAYQPFKVLFFSPKTEENFSQEKFYFGPFKMYFSVLFL